MKESSNLSKQRRLVRLADQLKSQSHRSLSMEAAASPVVVKMNGPLATVVLNRPQKLNSLNLEMVRILNPVYQNWLSGHPEGSQEISCVLMKAAGDKAFCAGGDVAAIQEELVSRKPADGSLATNFFYEEYQLNHKISQLYPSVGTLHIALWNGIVMGGGVGLSVHGKVRIATEKAMFAMPETGIGLFPDVGGTHVLSRLFPNPAVGMYIALCGKRLRKDDLLYTKLATHFLPSSQLEEFEARLNSLATAVNAQERNYLKRIDHIHAIVDELASKAPDGVKYDPENSELKKNEPLITRCFGKSSVQQILSELELLESEGNQWASKTLGELRRMSPKSLRVTFEVIKRHSEEQVTLGEALKNEYRVAQRFMRLQPDSDFTEGIRAVLVDKVISLRRSLLCPFPCFPLFCCTIVAV